MAYGGVASSAQDRHQLTSLGFSLDAVLSLQIDCCDDAARIASPFRVVTMPRAPVRPFGLLLLLQLSALSACAKDSTAVADPVVPIVTAAPTVANANVIATVVVGASVFYDASRSGTTFTDPAKGGLIYTVAFTGNSAGLTSNGCFISGTPTVPGVIAAKVTATDNVGRVVSDSFSIVVFASGLLVPKLPAASLLYSDAAVPLPAHFRVNVDGVSATTTDNTPLDNPTTNAGATLGRVLFYDTRLSANDAESCASCHVQSTGFSDVPQRSVGFAGGLTNRHSIGLSNARFYKPGRFFWDERAATLEAQVLMPVQDATEMGMTLGPLVTKLSVTSYYPALFNAAFGSTAITTDRIARALAQFTRSFVSSGSRYDKAFSATGVANFASVFNAEEIAGEQLFRSVGCVACHSTVAHVADSVHNIGLDATATDLGAGGGAFKAPSLRNVAVRPRYMHDGRFTSLDQVVDFFDSGVKANPTLDARLKNANGTPRQLGLTTVQKLALVAYLKTLTDSTFLTDARFSNPFVKDTVVVSPPAPSPTNAFITIQNTAYHPPSITVAPGAVVTFTNLDNTRHSANFSSAQIVSTPIFSTGSQTVTMPATPGSYHFQCAVHGAAMSGTVIVQ